MCMTMCGGVGFRIKGGKLEDFQWTAIMAKTTCLFQKPGFHAVYYVGTMPRFVRAKNCFVGIILCSIRNVKRYF